MEQTAFQFVSPLIFLYLVVSALLAYLLIKVPKQYKLKWLGIPVVLFCGLFSYEIYVSKLGRPVPIYLPEDQEFELVDVRRSLDPNFLEVWIIEQSRKSRLIIIPFDAELFKDMNKALERGNKSGVPQLGRRKKIGGQGGNGDDLIGSDFQFYDLPYEKILPKNNPQQDGIPNPVEGPGTVPPPQQQPPARDQLAPPPVAPPTE